MMQSAFIHLVKGLISSTQSLSCLHSSHEHASSSCGLAGMELCVPSGLGGEGRRVSEAGNKGHTTLFVQLPSCGFI